MKPVILNKPTWPLPPLDKTSWLRGVEETLLSIVQIVRLFEIVRVKDGGTVLKDHPPGLHPPIFMTRPKI